MQSKPPKRGVKAEEFRKFATQCLELRLRGMSVRDIALHLNSKPDLVEIGLRLLISPLSTTTREDALRLEMERLDAILVAFYDSACKGSAKAWEVVREISKLRGKYLGLFVPTKTVVFAHQDASAQPPPIKFEFLPIASGTFFPPGPPPPRFGLEPDKDRPN